MQNTCKIEINKMVNMIEQFRDYIKDGKLSAKLIKTAFANLIEDDIPYPTNTLDCLVFDFLSELNRKEDKER